MKFYCYTGDIKKLIPNGWTFQKLYARNYKTYRKSGIIMYVISKMCLEFNNIKLKYQPKVVGFILDNIDKPYSFWREEFMYGHISAWVLQEGQLMSRKQAHINKRDWYLEWEKNNDIPYLEDGERIRFKWVRTIKELLEFGDIELKEIR